jgi:hypothetical protein
MNHPSTNITDDNFPEILKNVRALILGEDPLLLGGDWPIDDAQHDYLGIDILNITSADTIGWVKGFIKCHFRATIVDREPSSYTITFYYNYSKKKFVTLEFNKGWKRKLGNEEWKNYE